MSLSSNVSRSNQNIFSESVIILDAVAIRNVFYDIVQLSASLSTSKVAHRTYSYTLQLVLID